MLLPIETQYDETNNIVSATTDRVGTYCLMDMEMFFQNLGIEPSKSADVEGSEAMSENSIDNDNYKCYTVNEMDALSSNPGDEGYMGPVSTYKDNFDVYFVVDRANYTDEALHSYCQKILETSEKIWAVSPNVNIVLYAVNGNGYSHFDNYGKFKNAGALKTELDKISQNKNVLTTTLADGTTMREVYLSKAVDSIINKYDGKRKIYGFVFFDSANNIFQTKGDSKALLYGVKYGGKKIDISVCSNIPEKYKSAQNYDEMAYAVALYKMTNGIDISANDFTKQALEHIYGEVPVKAKYNMILATGLRTVKLKAPITEEYADLAKLDEIDETQPDTDEDGLPDYKEINFNVKGADGKPLIEFINGAVDLPKYGECIDIKSELTYVERGFNRFDDVVINDIAFLNYVYNTVNVLPIVSDPTSEDGDRDLISDIKDHYPLIEEDYNVFNHDLYLNAKGEFGCSGCGIIIQSPDVQDKTILTEDDYLKVKSLKNEFLQQISRSNKGELTLEEYEEFYSKSIFIYQIEIIRSQEQYAKQYDFKGPNGVYYSDFLESFDINNYINEYDSKGNIAYIHYYGCNVVNYEDNKINFDYTYVIVPQIFYLSGVAISFVADPFIAILGSATISSIPPIAFDEYSSSDFMWTCLMSITSSVFPHGIVNSSTKICDIVKTETQSTITDKRPMEGDKFVYVVWGCHCNHDYVCNFPGGNVVKTYWYREGELVLYE